MKHTRTLFFALALLLSAPVQMHAQEVEQPQIVQTQSPSLAAVLAQLTEIAASAGVALPEALQSLLASQWNAEDAQQQFEAAAAALEQLAADQDLAQSAVALIADLKQVLEQTYAELIAYESAYEQEPTSKKAKEVFCTVFIKNLLNVCGNLFVNGKVTINPRPGASNTLVLEVNGNTNIDGNITVNTITIREGVIEDTGEFNNLIVNNNVTIESFDRGVVQSDVNGLLFSSTNITQADQLSLPATTGNTVGVINIDGFPVLHTFNDQTNIFVGTDAGNFTTSGVQTTAVGAFSLQSNVDGNNNTAVGYNVLSINTSGSDNTGVGSSALESNVTGNNNTAVGSNALFDVDTGSNNVAVGAFALLQNDTGSNNTAVGFEAARSTEGSDNTAVGYVALRNTTTGTANVAVGTRAFTGNVTGNNSTFVGFEAGQAASESGITAVGYRAALNAGVPFITAVGFNALTANDIGLRNTAVGASTLAANDPGNDNTAVGFEALSLNTSGSDNTAVGSSALNTNVTGSNNVAVGSNALANNVLGSSNVAIGRNALTANSLGLDNVAIGDSSAAAYNGSGIVAIGSGALLNATNVQNTAVGTNALRANVGGTENTVVGFNSLVLCTGSSNTALGNEVLEDLLGGNGNIAIGSNAGSAYVGNEGGNILIGNAGVALENNTIRIGNGQTRNFQAGIRGVTTAIADAVPVLIDSANQLGTINSSRRFKENIKSVDASLTDKLMQLRPVEYNYISDEQKQLDWGLIAEEVVEILPRLVVNDAQGQPLTVRYHVLPAMLLHMIQQQQQRIDNQQQQIDQLRSQLAA